MSVPNDPGAAQQASISTPDLWDLHASPASLEELASAWRKLHDQASLAQDTVDHAAYRVFADEAWQGETADTYDGHRQRLTRDVGQLAARAKPVAEALEYLAEVLRVNQELLSQERARLAQVPVTQSGAGPTFYPEDADQARLVDDAIAAGQEIRARVDDALAAKSEIFGSTQADLTGVSDTWKPRTVRVLDLNIFQGGTGNKPWPYDDAPKGVDHGDVDELGQLILDNGADVATLQEAFQGDMERLEEWLEEETGEEWDMHFAAASHKMQWDDAVGVEGEYGPFGNAVLVRRGGDIASSEELPEVTLREDGIVSGPEGRSMEGAEITLTDD